MGIWNNLLTIENLIRVKGDSIMPRYENSYEPEMRRGRRGSSNRSRNYTSNHYEEYPYYDPIYQDEYMMDEYPMDYRNEYRNEYRNAYNNGYRNEYQNRMRSYQNDNYSNYGNYRNMAGRSGMSQQPRMGFGKSNEEMLSDKELKMWVQEMETTDNNGSVVKRGEKFSEQQTGEMAKRLGVKFDKFSEKAFWATVNMMFSDYYAVLGENPDIYARLAKAWLCDKDVAMMGDEKLHAYHCYIVEGEEY